ncbi:hypothetical protein PFLUV_G00126010 [Perca fluviatilis]|uniref:Ig-like domain-containing protein n=1 Tax=Perca fluviatilis TaxID=8168 RepID=A0A6A5F434_PERFL|nr:hypothetical protein PFLUV_G00126010 [Perca fluviatilis]
MIRRLAVLILLSTMYLIRTAEVPHQISLTVVEVGRNVTLECPVSETGGKFFYWYKQPLGYTFQRVVAEILSKLAIDKQFNNSRFTVTKRDAQYFLTITNISKEDEATYFCHYGVTYSESFNGIFLAVNDLNQQKAVYVKQSPETESVKPGDSVTLQCSLLSKTKGNTDQCPGEHRVYWFRSGSGESHLGALSASHHRDNDRSTVDQSNDLDGEARAMNYAALDFSTKEMKRGKRKKRESPPECVYSVVRADDHNQHQPSL